MIFIVDGAVKVVSFVMRSKAPWNIFVPLDNTTFGVQSSMNNTSAPRKHLA